MNSPQVTRLLKQDGLGRVERLECADGPRVRRTACGGRLPGSKLFARLLLARERRALRALEGLIGVPRLAEEDTRSEDLMRSWIEGTPLHRAPHLAQDFFEHLDELVHEIHRRGVCHNDLHKEQNILVGSDGFPYLIDFQLASLHARPGRVAESRMHDDLRHVQKHRRRYTRDGRAPAGVRGVPEAARMRRSWTAGVWRRSVKPLYEWLTRSVFEARDGEERRPSSGPWPDWTPSLGPRPGP